MNQNSTVTVSLTVKNVAEALDFYTRALGATEMIRMPLPSGEVVHGEFMIGNSHFYISTESPEWQALAMPDGTKASCLFAVNVDDCAAASAKAVDAGAELITPPEDQFWGMRTSLVADPFGYRWNVRQLLEELSHEEILKRAAAIFGG